jgi:hypothetical protein
MRHLKFLIVLGGATAALAVGLGAQAQADQTDILSLLGSAIAAIS